MTDPDFEKLDPKEKKRLIFERQLASIPTSSSETLAAHVVAYHALKINKEIALECMKELARRKEGGDNFDYEAYIEEKLSDVPKPQGLDYAKIIKNMQSGMK